MKKYLFLLAALVFMFIGSSCKQSSKNISDGKPKVYTSFYAIYDFAKKIGADKIHVENIMPPGIEPHDWEISTRDIMNLESADALIYNGAGLEHWVDKVKKTLQNKIEYANLTENMQIENDPHVWLNPLLAKKQCEIIEQCFCKIDVQNKNYYQENYLAVAKKFDELDSKIREATKNFRSKNIVVAHQAYKYFCDEYGLNQIALEGIEEDSEPTVERMKEVSDFIKKNNVKYIFYEGQPSKAIQIISEDTGATILELNPFEYLTKEQIDNGEDYFSVMEKNLENLKVALE